MKSILRSSLALLVVTFGLVPTARPQAETRPPANAKAPGFEGMPGRATPGYERLYSVLTDDQRASLRESMAEEREKIRSLEEKLHRARRALFETGLSDTFDEETVRAKAMAAAKIEAEMTVARARALSKMRPPLKPEQLQKLKDSPAFATPNAPEAGGENSRRRPSQPRDENGLPPKDKPAQP